MNRDDLEILNSTPLSKVLEEVMGGEDVGGIQIWKICKGDSIQIRNANWYNFNRQKGGDGAISLVSHWLQLYGNIDEAKIQSQTIDILMSLNEKLALKKELECGLKNDNIQTPKIKI